MFKIIFFVFFLFISVSKIIFAEDTCQKWFHRTGISSVDTECIIKCSSSSVDMGTFDCPNNCDQYCKKNLRPICETNKAWKKKIRNDLPPQWPNKQEKLSPLSSDESKMLDKTLAKLSDTLLVDDLIGIYKLEAPKDLFSFGTPSSYVDRQIVLYQRAYYEPEKLIHYVVHELAHHLHETSLKKEFESYKKSLKWTKGNPTRPGPFWEVDGQDSPEEDFANNFEAYVLSPEALKLKVPQAYEWMQKYFKNKFKLKECQN